MLLSLEITHAQTQTFREPLHGPPDIQEDLVIILVVLSHISTCNIRNVIITSISISSNSGINQKSTAGKSTTNQVYVVDHTR